MLNDYVVACWGSPSSLFSRWFAQSIQCLCIVVPTTTHAAAEWTTCKTALSSHSCSMRGPWALSRALSMTSMLMSLSLCGGVEDVNDCINVEVEREYLLVLLG